MTTYKCNRETCGQIFKEPWVVTIRQATRQAPGDYMWCCPSCGVEECFDEFVDCAEDGCERESFGQAADGDLYCVEHFVETNERIALEDLEQNGELSVFAVLADMRAEI
jgi:hypothetical protein